jgi:hypothetical protein
VNTTILTIVDGRPALIRGTPFEAIFTVQAPAHAPAPGAPPDPVMVKPGTAEFITTNVVVQAT